MKEKHDLYCLITINLPIKLVEKYKKMAEEDGRTFEEEILSALYFCAIGYSFNKLKDEITIIQDKLMDLVEK